MTTSPIAPDKLAGYLAGARAREQARQVALAARRQQARARPLWREAMAESDAQGWDMPKHGDFCRTEIVTRDLAACRSF